MPETQALAAFAALSDPTRLSIIRHLSTERPDGAAAGDIAKAVGATSSRASFHLATLTHAGLVRSKKVSRSVIYQADFAAIGALVAYVVGDCCAGHPTVVSCCAAVQGQPRPAP